MTGTPMQSKESPAMQAYLRELRRIKPLTPDEEAIIARKAKGGDRRALERLCAANLRFVLSTAKKFRHHGLPLEDLVCEGNLALLQAARSYEADRGFKFITFAVMPLRWSLEKAVTTQHRTVYLPRNESLKVAKISQAAKALEQVMERVPVPEEIAAELGWPVESVSSSMAHGAASVSLEQSLAGGSESCWLDVLEGEDQAAEWLEREALREQVNALLAMLPVRERQVIGWLFGLWEDRELTITEVAERLGIHPERVRQIKHEVLGKLKIAAVVSGDTPCPLRE